MVFRYFCSHAEKRAWHMLSQSFSRQTWHFVNSVLWLNILRVFWWCSILTPGVAAGPWSKPHACRGYLHETLQSRGRKLQDAKDALEHSQRYRVVEYVLLTIISSFPLHFGAAEDSRSQSNQRMAQTALTQMLSAVAPKFARCKMRLTKFTEHSIYFFKCFRGNCSHFASGHYSADGVEFSWHAALTWICKVSMFSKCFWSSLIKSDQVLGVLFFFLFFFLCGGPAELMKLGMLALGSDSLFEKRRHFITCPIT